MANPRRRYGAASFKGLCELVKDRDELVRAEACAELGRRGREASRAVERLVLAAAYDESGSVRGSAASAVASIASAGEAELVLEVIAATRKSASYPATAFLAHALEIVELAVAARAR